VFESPRARFARSTSTHPTDRNRITNVKRCRYLLASVVFLVFSIGQLLPAESLDDSINYLLDYVANSNATFIRNGQAHTPQEAANHIKAKYEHFKNEIKTPQDFIRLSASKSLLTGQPYLVRTADGKEMRLDAWLTSALEKHPGQ
jgi:Family of unknown function (DUF5329)